VLAPFELEELDVEPPSTAGVGVLVVPMVRVDGDV
jgi:hypothetical protein